VDRVEDALLVGGEGLDHLCIFYVVFTIVATIGWRGNMAVLGGPGISDVSSNDHRKGCPTFLRGCGLFEQRQHRKPESRGAFVQFMVGKGVKVVSRSQEHLWITVRDQMEMGMRKPAAERHIADRW